MIVEDGNFIPGASSYVSIAYANQYFIDRFNPTWNAPTNTPDHKTVALIDATDYAEARFSNRFLGIKEFNSNKQARNVLTLLLYNNNPLTITVGGIAAIAGTSFSRGTTRSEMLTNMVDWFNDQDLPFTAAVGIDNTVVFTYDAEGSDGNYVACVSSDASIASFALTTMLGGSSITKPQRLSFPRRYLMDRNGVEILGVPEQLKMAVCEYAVRSRAAPLLPDPATSENGQPLKRVFEKIGPIETETEYQSQTSNRLQSYPAADRLLLDLLGPSSGVIR
jgi:hypothetical protein